MDGHPFLKQPITTPVPIPLPDEVLDLILKTGQTLKGDLGYHTNRAMALCSSQVGIPYRFFVTMNFKGQNPYSKLNYVINPRIKRFHADKIIFEEGCLSIPTLLSEVERHNVLDVEYYNLDARLIQRQIQGTEAVVFQHEYDHLDGILMTDKIKDPNRTKPNEDYFKYLARVNSSRN